ncbi:MAG: hypothetical protein MI757_12785, partial [Pirellulales bacterium]|nr:hypothetical protein [Pirellulales bacterium]
MQVNDRLHQKLLEYLYGLLDDAEAKKVAEQISSDPEVARAYSLARHDVELIAQAAEVVVPEVPLHKPKREDDVAPKRRASSPTLHWAIGVAATLLVMAAGAAYFMQGPDEAEIAQKHMRLIVTGPAKFQPGVDNTYTVAASTIDGQPASRAEIEFKLSSPGGEKGKLIHH